MKNLKKLSVAIVALAMCALLGISVWAANWLDVTYTATFDNKSTLCVTGAEQTATLTVKTSSAVKMDSITAQLTSDLEIISVTFGSLTGAEWDTETGMIMWYSADAENVTTDTLAVVTVKVPATVAAGSYKVDFEIIDISSDYGTVWETGATVSATLTVAEHSYTASYTDNGDGTHTANYVCANDQTHTKIDDPVSHDFTNGDCVCGSAKPATGLKGDVDLDGDVDSDDLTLLARHVGGIEYITDATALANADVIEDGTINSDDLTKHARYVGGIITDWSQD